MRRSEGVSWEPVSTDSHRRTWEVHGGDARSAALGHDLTRQENAPVRRRVAERHRRVRLDASGRVVEDHQAIRLTEEYGRRTGPTHRPLRQLVVAWSALIGGFLSVAVAGANLGGWAALAVGLGWAVLMGVEAIPVLALFWVVAAVVSVLLQSYWGAIFVAVPFSFAFLEVDEAGRTAE